MWNNKYLSHSKENGMIEKYFLSNCLIVIEEFNERFRDCDNLRLKEFADTQYSEADLIFLLGFPFKQMTHFSMQGKSKEMVSDIEIKSLGFKIEVKFLKNNFTPISGNYSGSVKWERFLEDYNWLAKEIKNGNKKNRAFIMGWFNAYESFGNIMQLGKASLNGKSSGPHPEISRDKLDFFPFLLCCGEGNKTKNTVYNYEKAYDTLHVIRPTYPDDSIQCIFLGKPTDKFHFVIYY